MIVGAADRLGGTGKNTNQSQTSGVNSNLPFIIRKSDESERGTGNCHKIHSMRSMTILKLNHSYSQRDQ